MPGIDESRPFVPLKIAVLTVSDTRKLEDDKSGNTLAERIGKAGHTVAARAIVTDDVEKIRAQMRTWIADHELGGGDLLFRTRTGRRPAPSNWARALQRACRAVEREPMRVYDCRHACATTWLRAGVPLLRASSSAPVSS